MRSTKAKKKEGKAKARSEDMDEDVGGISQKEREDLASAILASLADQDSSVKDTLTPVVEESIESLATAGDPVPVHDPGGLPTDSGPASSSEDLGRTLHPQSRQDNLQQGNVLPSETVQTEETKQARWVAQESLLEELDKRHSVKESIPKADIPADVDSASSSSSDPEIEDVQRQSLIIGKVHFDVDNNLLDDYLSSILEFWYGKRPPKGVDVELTRRCL